MIYNNQEAAKMLSAKAIGGRLEVMQCNETGLIIITALPSEISHSDALLTAFNMSDTEFSP